MYKNMMKNFYYFLKVGGSIITSESGMNWTTELNLVSNNFLQNGGYIDILSINDLEEFSKKYDLKIKKLIQTFGFFKRNTEIIYKITKQHEA